MNYYEHHIGDFRSGTVNMTRLERWIYRDLIEVYYDTERPLTVDVEKLCKDIGARSEEEKEVVRELLVYKFTLTGDGYVHERCQAIIESYHSRADTARENGKKGGRPPKSRDGNREKPTGFNQETKDNQPETGSQTNQKPVTNNHQPEEKTKAPRAKRATRPTKTSLPVDFSVSDRVRYWAAENGHARLDEHFDSFVRKARAKGYEYASWDDAFMEAIRADWAGLKKQQGPPRALSWSEKNDEVIAQLTGRSRYEPDDRTIDI
jgi:uncharacterized protein YdaU (DUF1376 family)